MEVLSGPEHIALVMKDGAIQTISPELEAGADAPALQAAE
jgi:hypothetical protein